MKTYQLRQRWPYVTDRSGPAFLLNNHGTRLRGNTAGYYLKRLVKRAGLSGRITPHVLRHSIATHLLLGGMPVERVRDFLGHDHLETTQLYTHVGGSDHLPPDSSIPVE